MRQEITKVELMSEDEAREVFRQACVYNDPKAQQRIQEAFLPLAAATATKAARYGEQIEEDLLGIASLALAEAINRFRYKDNDGNRGRFIAFVRKAMTGALLNHRRDDQLVRTRTTVRGRELYAKPEEAATPFEEELVQFSKYGAVPMHAFVRGDDADPLTVEETIMSEVKTPEDILIEREEQEAHGNMQEAVDNFLEQFFTHYERMCWRKYVETGNASPGLAGKPKEMGAVAVSTVRTALQEFFK